MNWDWVARTLKTIKVPSGLSESSSASPAKGLLTVPQLVSSVTSTCSYLLPRYTDRNVKACFLSHVIVFLLQANTFNKRSSTSSRALDSHQRQSSASTSNKKKRRITWTKTLSSFRALCAHSDVKFAHQKTHYESVIQITHLISHNKECVKAKRCHR